MFNPIFNNLKENLKEYETRNYSLFLSILSLLINVCLFFTCKYINNNILLAVSIVSLILYVVLTILFSKYVFNMTITIIYVIVYTLFLISISYYLYNVIGDNFIYREIPLIISSTIVLDEFINEIIEYIKGYLLNHFFYKLLFLNLCILFIGSLLLYLYLKMFNLMYFIYVLLMIVVSILYSYVLIYYQYKLKDFKVDKKYIGNYNIIKFSLINYLFIELIYLFKK